MRLKLTKNLTWLLSLIVMILSVADAATFLLSPWWLKVAYEKGYGELGILFGTVYNKAHPGGNYYFMVAFVMLCGIFILAIFYDALKILGRIRKEQPFCYGNARSFQEAGIFSVILSVLFFVKMFVSPSILTLMCSGIFILFAMFMFVLSELFHIATTIKEENELTI